MRHEVLVSVTLALLLAPGSVLAKDDVYLQTTFKGLTYHGSYGKHLPVAVGEVRDKRLVPDPRFMGAGINGVYKVYSEDPPAKYVEASLAKAIESLGLAVKPGEEPALRVSAEIWRAHAWVRSGARARMRCEINVRFSIGSPTGEPQTMVAVLGNSEIKAQVVTNAKWSALFDEAIYDTFEKLATSQVLAKALGPEVAASFAKASVAEPEPRYKMDQIEKDKFYGPTDVVGKLPKIDLSAYDALALADFAVVDDDFEGDKAVVQKMIPDALWNRLGGLYPALFRSVARNDAQLDYAPTSGKKLLLKGEVLDVNVGSWKKRAFIGFGAGKANLDLAVLLVDAETGKELARLPMESENWGASWTVSEGELDDMVDRMAADVVYYLRNQTNASYAPSEDQML